MNALENLLNKLRNDGSTIIAFGESELGNLRAFVKEHRELETRFNERGDRLLESAKEITVLKEKLASREGERCDNCKHAKVYQLRTDPHINCSRILERMPNIAWCPEYEAKPKVKRCKWVIQNTITGEMWITDIQHTPDEARTKYGNLIIGPVEGTWEEVE